MNRITTSGNLPDGKNFTAVVTPGHIVVRVEERICVAHNRWFDTAEAYELMGSLAIALRREQLCTCGNDEHVTAAMRTETGQHLTGCPLSLQFLHAPQPESDIPT